MKKMYLYVGDKRIVEIKNNDTALTNKESDGFQSMFGKSIDLKPLNNFILTDKSWVNKIDLTLFNTCAN